MLEFLQSISKENYEVLYVTGKDYYDDFVKNNINLEVIMWPFKKKTKKLKEIKIILEKRTIRPKYIVKVQLSK